MLLFFGGFWGSSFCCGVYRVATCTTAVTMRDLYKPRLGVSSDVVEKLLSDLKKDPTPLLRFLHTTSSMQDLSLDEEMEGYRGSGGLLIYDFLREAAPVLQQLYIAKLVTGIKI